MIGAVLTAQYGGRGFISLFILMFLTAVITIVIKIIKAKRRKRQIEEAEAKERAEKEAEEEEKRSQIKQQKDLLVRFKSSDVTKELILYICDGTPDKKVPEKITIYNDRIEAVCNKKTIIFDFASQGINSFEHVVKVTRYEEDLRYVVKPQMILAEALNALLFDQYIIDDSANWKSDYCTDSDGDGYIRILYTSQYVTLTLKSTLPNRSF